MEYLSVFNIALLRIQYISEQTNESMRCNHLLHLGLSCDSLSNFDILFHAAYMRSLHPTSSLLQSAKASAVPLLILRTTVPLVSYIRNSTDFGIMPPLVLVVKILKKIGITGKILGESGGQTFKGSDGEKCQF